MARLVSVLQAARGSKVFTCSVCGFELVSLRVHKVSNSERAVGTSEHLLEVISQHVGDSDSVAPSQ